MGSSTPLTSGGTSLWPTRSPDGRIAYVYAPKKGPTDLWVLDANGNHPLTSDPYDERSPEWSPDGNRIVFSSTRSGYAQLYTIDPTNPQDLQQLTDQPWHHLDPTWSPDRQWIAFGRRVPDGTGVAIWLLNVNHPADESLLWVHNGSVTDLAWSPDGAKIAFASGADIWTVDVSFDGAHWTVIGEQNLTHTAAGERWPTWSPTGDMIAFMTDRDKDNEIYAMKRDGSIPVNLTNSHRTDDGYPAWGR